MTFVLNAQRVSNKNFNQIRYSVPDGALASCFANFGYYQAVSTGGSNLAVFYYIIVKTFEIVLPLSVESWFNDIVLLTIILAMVFRSLVISVSTLEIGLSTMKKCYDGGILMGIAYTIPDTIITPYGQVANCFTRYGEAVIAAAISTENTHHNGLLGYSFAARIKSKIENKEKLNDEEKKKTNEVIATLVKIQRVENRSNVCFFHSI